MPTPYAATLEVDLAGDRDVWAKQILHSQEKRKKKHPREINLEDAITGISVTDTIVGSSTVEVKILDPGWYLTDSNFFTSDVGRLDPVEVNYPDGSRLWWRLTQCELEWGSDPELTLTFMERSAVFLMLHHGPKKASRGKMTRAQFIKSLCDDVKAGGGIHFQSIQLRDKQRLAHNKVQPSTDDPPAKTGGVTRDDKLKVKGIDLVAKQIEKINLVNDAVFEENASDRVALAINCAAIAESRYGAELGPRGTTFQTHEFTESQIKKQAFYFLHGGRSFAAGGAIGLAKAHRDWSPGRIALEVEGSLPNFHGNVAAGTAFYDKYRSEARAIVDAYGQLGPGATTTTEQRKQYNFRVGNEDNLIETYWDAILRLADEVKWVFFLDGNWAYYDAEKTLIMQRPSATIRRDNPAVVGFNCTVDNRNIATEATLKLICEPFDFRAGEVLKLVGFGPASSASSATIGGKPAYPGRWLIQEIERDVFELVSTFTLKQPQDREGEPDDAGTQKLTSSGGPDSGSSFVAGARKGSPIPGQSPHAPTHQTAGLPGYPAFDYMAPPDTPVVAPEDGKITRFSGHNPKLGGPPGGPLGWSIYMDGKSGKKYFLTHLGSRTCRVGDRVTQGQQIGTVADGPASWSQPHCHMGVHS